MIVAKNILRSVVNFFAIPFFKFFEAASTPAGRGGSKRSCCCFGDLSAPSVCVFSTKGLNPAKNQFVCAHRGIGRIKSVGPKTLGTHPSVTQMPSTSSPIVKICCWRFKTSPDSLDSKSARKRLFLEPRPPTKEPFFWNSCSPANGWICVHIFL